MTNEVKTTVELQFIASELLYDIANYGYIEGSLLSEEMENARHTTIDITQDGNIERVYRILSLAHTEVLHLLHPYTKEPISTEGYCLDNTHQHESSYGITLELPQDISRHTVELLRNQIHEYLVCRVLSDWVEITEVNRLVWLEKLERCRDSINKFKHYRVGRVRRTMRPF